jgi:hypothetical protein
LDLELDEKQQTVAGAPCSALQVVTAGPGTGKTRTLLARAMYLVEEEEVEQAQQLLILSFSRAAVEVVSQRSKAELDIGRLPIRTIDSFAAILLREAGIETAHTSYDERIRLATSLLDSQAVVGSRVYELRHVLVDEAQDIVGVRRVFVCRLLEVVTRADVEGNGYTVFGDAAQAIYEFQETEEPSAPGPARFLKQMLGLSSSALPITGHELETNYRMRSTNLIDLAADYGSELRSADVDSLKVWDDINIEIAADSGWDELDGAASAVKFASRSGQSTSVAVLCRTNAEVLVIGSKLQAAGVDIRVNHRALDRGAAPWLAREFAKAQFSKTKFERDLLEPESQLHPWFEVPAGIEIVLRHEGLMSGAELDLKRLGGLLSLQACPEALLARRAAPVVVSTVHRAKGQEFDVVFSVKGRRPTVNDDAAEEARVLYVAATRARSDLCQCPPLDLGGPTRATNSNDRLMVCSWQKRKQPRLVEVRVSDSDSDWNAETSVAFWSNQMFLEKNYLPGDQVELRLSDDQDTAYPVYDALHKATDGEETVVGRTNERFGEFISKYVWGRPPDVISGLSAEIPDAATMIPSQAHEVGLANHGIHLRARFFGLGQLGWSNG